MKHKVLYSILFSLIMQLAVGQTQVEIELKSNLEDYFSVIPLDSNGVLTINSQMTAYGRDHALNYQKYDSTLTAIWYNTYKPKFGYEFIDYFKTNNYLYTLLRVDKENEIQVIRTDLKNGNIVFLESNLLTNLIISHFKVVGNKIVISGLYNDKPVVELLNFFDNSSKVLPDLYNNKYEIRDIEVSQENKSIFVMLKHKKNCKYIIKEYNYNGKKIKEFELGSKDKLPLNGQILALPNNKYVLAGNYSDNCTSFSVGFYIHPLNYEAKTQFYDFIDFHNFYRYLPEKKETRIKERLKERKRKGKKAFIRNRVLLHDIVQYNNGFILVGEVYFPEMKNSVTANSLYFSPLNNPPKVAKNQSYNNYRFTNALVAAFDMDGNLKWDNSLNLNNVESPFLLPKVQINHLGEESFVLAYPDETTLKSETINAGSKQTQSRSLELEENNALKVYIENDETDLVTWYSDNFIAYGYKTYRNPSSGEFKYFFFMKKIPSSLSY